MLEGSRIGTCLVVMLQGCISKIIKSSQHLLTFNTISAESNVNINYLWKDLLSFSESRYL